MHTKSFVLTRWMMVFAIVFVLVLSAATPVQAAVIIEDDGELAADEVIDDDLLISAENVMVDGTVNGMVIAAGNIVVINGTVNGDVIAVGSVISVTENAQISGNLFSGASIINVAGEIDGSVAGGSTALNVREGANIGRNIYYGGFGLELEPGTTVGSDVRVGAYQVVLDGSVGKEVHAGAEAVELSGSVGGDAVLEVGDPEDAPPFNPFMFSFSFLPPEAQAEMPEMIDAGLRIADSAEIGGELTYTSRIDQTASIETQPEGGIVFMTPVPEVDEDGDTDISPGVGAAGALAQFGRWVLKVLRNFVTLMILGALCFWLLPNLFRKTVAKVTSQPWQSAGWGFLSLILGYIAAGFIAIVILMVGILISVLTLGGLSNAIFGVGFSSLALVFAVFQLLVTYGSKLVVSFLVGEKMLTSIGKKEDVKWIWALLVGVVIYVILRAVPFIGWLVGLVATVFGLGGMFLLLREWLRGRKATAETPAE